MFKTPKFLLVTIISFVVGIFAVASVILAVLAYSKSVEQTNKAEERATIAAKQSYAACVRSRTIGPPILKGYEKYKFLDAEQIKYYKETIPKSCHK